MIGPIKIVLLAVMASQDPVTGHIDLQYSPLDYYDSMMMCNNEKNRLQRKNPNKLYVCLRVDRD